MPTPILNLVEIELTDKIKTEFLDKLNSNMHKIDSAYGDLKELLIERTGQPTFKEAVSYMKKLNNTTGATATEEDIKLGKIAYANGEKVVGTYNPVLTPDINITLEGSQTSWISGYGAGINKNGVLVIWAMSQESAYEHIYFANTSIKKGTIDKGWNITAYDTSDPVNVPHACTINGLSGYQTIDIKLNCTAVNSSYDYVTIQVTVDAY